MKFIFYSPVSFEPWDWRNSVEKGIGGSETSHVEMAWRLRRRGHEILSYNTLPEDSPGEWRGTTWKPLADCDFHDTGVWVWYRCPQVIAEVEKMPGQVWWFIMQDWDYSNDWPAIYDKLDRIAPLSQAHADYLLAKHPELEPKIWITSNAVKIDLIEAVENDSLVRDPYSIIYASSPDRGLLSLCYIFSRAREYLPQLKLDVYYGFDNIDKLIAMGDKGWAAKKAQIMKAMDQPNVKWHGRTSQHDLYHAWLTSGIWCYPSNFWETSCITCMEAQAMGAIPLINPVWAQGENTHHGVFIEGDAENDPYTQVRFAAELVRLASNPELQQQIREEMMPDARRRFDWEVFVDQWEDTACADLGGEVQSLQSGVA